MALPLSIRFDLPQVFLCYADANRLTADDLHRDLDAHGVRMFSPQRDTLPGDQIVQAVEEHIGESDYFVLLWSHACVGQSWVRDQWQAKLHDSGGFLLVFRLDATRVPSLLAARRQFNAFDGWSTAVKELAASWETDRAHGLPVLPAPGPHSRPDGPTVTLYIRNRALGVSHVLAVPAAATGARLRAQVRTELALKDEVSDFGGRLGFRFSYDLLKDERPLPDLPLGRLGVGDNATLDLEITARSFTPDGEHTPVAFRRDPGAGPALDPVGRGSDAVHPGMSPDTRRSLLTEAFGHLMPRRNR
ncbi:toll/interleukin-1 receptor domain-containing protein [Actinomadura graeca]|uniref:Toll/interleukin-1 receptor domain-containing protein n=1 Tax=Actinomadura graeca TaxID=2750812 RepID=A0ABX8QR29_9ACTN|nr:toll/interleukin-1 receptor domain-containing protein [Actinomadura graeca]QXJ21182.1 toll/interleukin-1 receptor domain-containing protein [Actinomadura graeca]